MYEEEKYTNNARGTLVQALGGSKEDCVLSLTYEEGGQFFPFDYGREGVSFFQRATLTHPSRPGQFEIISITGRDDDGAGGGELVATRGIEGTPIVSWPVGTLVEARVTAGMLGGFTKEVNERGAVLREVNRRYGFEDGVFVLDRMLVPGGNRGPMIGESLARGWPSFGTPVFGRTPEVSLGNEGLHELRVGEWVMHGGCYAVPGMPDLQVLVEIVRAGDSSPSHGYNVQLSELPSIPSYWTDPDIRPYLQYYAPEKLEVSSWDEEYRVYFHALPVVPSVPAAFTAPMMVTEVGFVCTHASIDPSGAPPKLTVIRGLDADYYPESALIDSQEMTGLDGWDDIFRFVTPVGASKLYSGLLFRLEQPAAGRLFGYFYWVGLPLGWIGSE